MNLVLFPCLKSWDCDSDSVEISPGHSQNICIMRRAMTLPNTLNTLNFGTPSMISLWLPISCPAIHRVVQISNSTVFSSPGIGPCLCPTLFWSYSTPVQHLHSSWCCLLWQIDIRITLQFSIPTARSSSGHKGAEPTACKREGVILWHRSLSSGAKPGINPKCRGITFCLPSKLAHSSSSSLLVPFLFTVTLQARLNPSSIITRPNSALLKSHHLPAQNMGKLARILDPRLPNAPIYKRFKHWCCTCPEEVAERCFCLQQVRDGPAVFLGIKVFPLAFWFTVQSIGFFPLL